MEETALFPHHNRSRAGGLTFTGANYVIERKDENASGGGLLATSH